MPRLSIILLVTSWSWSFSFARQLVVGLNSTFQQISQLNGLVAPGDTVLIRPGIYQAGTQFLNKWIGQVNQPITILAESSGQVIFRGGTESMHLSQCAYVHIIGLIIEQQTGNGLNIDDGGVYTQPSKHIHIRGCIFRDMSASGNNDLLKLSGLDSFLISDNMFINGSAGGSGIDMVGCHHGTIEDNYFDRAGVTGLQAKGGTQYLIIRRNVFKDMSQRALNLGGSTGLEFFRPPLPSPIRNAFEAADLDVYSNVFIGSWAPVAFVGCVRVRVINNTIYQPVNWVLRILQETTEDGFLPCGQNLFQNNIIYLSPDLTEVNIGPNTDAASFIFTHNLWYNVASSSWAPNLPVIDPHEIRSDPGFVNSQGFDFHLSSSSPALRAGLKTNAPDSDFENIPFSDPPSIGAFSGPATTTALNPSRPQDIFISPNPVVTNLQISVPNDKYILRFISTSGQVSLSQPEVSLPGNLNISGLPPGTYWLELYPLTQSSGRPFSKLVIKL